MRAPGEAPGMMALEIAIDEMAERLALDAVEFRIINDTQVDPENPERPFSHRNLVGCLRTGAERFGWRERSKQPGARREGNWLIGMGVAAAFRNNLVLNSGARVRLDREGIVTVETDMTDIGTGSYTIIAQTAAEMLGVPIEKVAVSLGDSRFPVSSARAGSSEETAPQPAYTRPAPSCGKPWRRSSVSTAPTTRSSQKVKSGRETGACRLRKLPAMRGSWRRTR